MPPVKSIKLSIIYGAVLGASIVCSTAFAQSPTPVPQDQERGQTSYMKVDITDPFSAIMARMTAAKPGIEKEHTELLNERYDLSDRPAQATMSRGKPLQEGVRVKLPPGTTWEMLAAMSPEQIRDKNLFPKGFYPLPHPNHPEGGMVFPHLEIDEIKKQEER